MIVRYSVQNFKQLKNIEMNCKDLNIVIGPNGAGKSSLLQSIDFLKAFVLSSVQFYMETRNINYRDIFHTRNLKGRIVRKASIYWKVSLVLFDEHTFQDQYHYRYEVRFGLNGAIHEKVILCLSDGEQNLLERNHRSYEVLDSDGNYFKGDFLNPSSGFLATLVEGDFERFPHLVRIKKYLENIQTFLIWDPALLRNRSRGKFDEIGPNGQNLATVLDELKRREPVQFQKMVGRLRRVFPTLKDIVIKGIRSGWKEIQIIEQSENGTISFNHRQISDGTLRLLAIALIRYSLKKRSVVSFEEPENGVHPPILKEAVQMIDEMTQLKPNLRTQVFISTHNPYLLDFFQDRPDIIFVLEKGDGETGTLITNLSEENLNTARLLFDNSLGDMWFSDFLFNREDKADFSGQEDGKK